MKLLKPLKIDRAHDQRLNSSVLTYPGIGPADLDDRGSVPRDLAEQVDVLSSRLELGLVFLRRRVAYYQVALHFGSTTMGRILRASGVIGATLLVRGSPFGVCDAVARV